MSQQMYAIPTFLYIEARSPEEARLKKDKVERLLQQPMLKTYLAGQGISLQGVVVQDPGLAPSGGQ